MSPPENKKNCPGKVFGIKPPSNLTTYEQEGALDARMRDCLNIISAQKWYAVIFQISEEKSFQA